MFHKIGFTRPENLWRDFSLERKSETTNARGRAINGYVCEPPVFLHAILCGATPEQMERFHQLGHPVSHVISHTGKPRAKAGDRLILGSTAYYIRGVDEPGDQGIWTLYYCEERSDAHDENQLG